MCDTFVALSPVTKQKKTILAKNSDRPPNEAQHLVRIPARIHESGEQVQCTYIEIPQGTSRPVDWNHNINNFTWGGISPSLTAGSKTIEGGSTATSVILGVEVTELAAPPSGSSSGSWFMIFQE